jgi:hypothetical protein
VHFLFVHIRASLVFWDERWSGLGDPAKPAARDYQVDLFATGESGVTMSFRSTNHFNVRETIVAMHLSSDMQAMNESSLKDVEVRITAY